MKKSKVFVLLVVLLLFVVLSNILPGKQVVFSQEVVPDNVVGLSENKEVYDRQQELAPSGIDPYHPVIDPLRQMMDKRMGDTHKWREAPRYPIQGRDDANTSSGLWKIEAVDAPKYFNYLSSKSIAVDGSNHPHITYGGDHLYYAYHDGSKWHYETVDSASEVGSYASIALDRSGKVHISYYDDDDDDANKDLKYATNASGSWKTEIVDSGGNVGEYNSLAVDILGKVHINVPVNDPISYLHSNSLAVDTSGKVHISYFDWTNYDLKYATNSSGSWVTEIVDSGEHVGVYNSLAVDTSGKVHISYFTDYPNYDLKYATNGSGSWKTEIVDSGGYIGEYNSLAVDTSGKVHISYFDATNGDLKYATNASGSWVTTTVDSSGGVGSFNSLALDTSGKAHISYCDATNYDLKYATNAINKPTVKTRYATKVTDTSATLNGIVNGHGLRTTVWFKYGTTRGSYTHNSSKKTVKGSKDKKVGIGISELKSQTKYYYRIVAKNRDGTSYGVQKSFTTQ